MVGSKTNEVNFILSLLRIVSLKKTTCNKCVTFNNDFVKQKSLELLFFNYPTFAYSQKQLCRFARELRLQMNSTYFSPFTEYFRRISNPYPCILKLLFYLKSFLCLRFQTVSGAHSVSCPVGTRGSFPASKAAGA
jgi:hypothetical protein